MPSPRRTPAGQVPRRPASSRGSAQAGIRRGAGRDGTGRARWQSGTSAAGTQRPGVERTPGGAPTQGRRPGVRRTTASSNERRRLHRRRDGRFTSRAAILAVVLAILVLTLAYPVQQYIAQEATISDLERAQTLQERRIAALSERREKWDDPAFVRAQARKRLQLVEPGEVAYVIQESGPGAVPLGPDGRPRARVPESGPWYSRLWGSVEAADRPTQVAPDATAGR